MQKTEPIPIIKITALWICWFILAGYSMYSGYAAFTEANKCDPLCMRLGLKSAKIDYYLSNKTLCTCAGPGVVRTLRINSP